MIQQTRLGLDTLDVNLANMIRECDDVRKRLFACKCASLAFEHCGNGDLRSLRAIETGKRYAQGLVTLRELNTVYMSAERAADEADQKAFDIQDAYEKKQAREIDYNQAFGVARAAFSAKGCCCQSAIEAADEAAYEAWAALRTVVEEGNSLNGLLPSNLYDAGIDEAIVGVFRSILLDILPNGFVE